MRANVIEAAEQCGIMSLPQTLEEQPLMPMLARWPSERLLVFCDEDYCHVDPVASLMAHRRKASGGPMAVIIGPEGGFHDEERAQMRGLPHCLPLSLGPRILRADTAAVAALALVQAVLGDWRKS